MMVSISRVRGIGEHSIGIAVPMEGAAKDEHPNAPGAAAGHSPRMPKRTPHFTKAIERAVDRARASLKRISTDRDVSVSAWEQAAEIGIGTLGKFIRGTNRDIGLTALLRLALAQKITVAEMIGETPVQPSAAIDRQLLTDILSAIERHLAETGEKIAPTEKALAIMVLYDAARRDEHGRFVMDELAINVFRLALRQPPRS